MSSDCRRINILGVTGSVGQSAAAVIKAHSNKFDVQTVSAHSNARKLAKVAVELKASYAVLSDAENFGELQSALAGTGIECSCGPVALEEGGAHPADITLVAVVGMAGLKPLMKAIENSGAVAIANKEPLVAAGSLVMAAAREHDTQILPVDSEHNAIFQVFDEEQREAIEKITLTASGGPFRAWAAEKIETATVEQALAHPNWDMGQKISIDSATMMNKALEVIEAHYLFNMPAEKIEVLVHPQSVVHSFVQYHDGSVLAQMGASDMRTPLANILGYPKRLQTPGQVLNLQDLRALTFEPVDHARFPAIKLAYDCLAAGQAACIALNAANEIAVEAFLNEEIGFSDIINIVQAVITDMPTQEFHGIDEVLDYDKRVRDNARDLITDKLTPKEAVSS